MLRISQNISTKLSHLNPGDDVAKILKEAFSAAIGEDPTSAADLARSMAESLALAGASADDIVLTMKEALAASLAASASTGAGLNQQMSPDDVLDLVETVSNVLNEAGATAEDVAEVAKLSLAAASAACAAGTPADGSAEMLADELTKTLAKALHVAGASGEEMTKALEAALKSSGGNFGDEECARLAVAAVAASGARPEDVAKAMFKLLADTGECTSDLVNTSKADNSGLLAGLDPDEAKRHVVEAMVTSGAAPADVALAMAQHSLMQSIGDRPEVAASSLLQAMRSGEDLLLEDLERIVNKVGIQLDDLEKSFAFERALRSCGVSSADLVKVMLLQKSLLDAGATPDAICMALNKTICPFDPSKWMQSTDDSAADVDSAIRFKVALDSAGAFSADADSAVELLCSLGRNPSSDRLRDAGQTLLSDFGTDQVSLTAVAALQKLLLKLELHPVALARVVDLQKCLYEAGASLQDISQTLNLEKDSCPEGLLQICQGFAVSLTPAEVIVASDLIAAFRSSSISSECVRDVALMKTSVESLLLSPEQLAKSAAASLRREDLSAKDLEVMFKELLDANGITPEALVSGALVQKSLSVLKIKPEELSAVIDTQQQLMRSGASTEEISQVFRDLVKSVDAVAIGDALIATLESAGSRLKEEDIFACADAMRSLGSSADENDTTELTNILTTSDKGRSVQLALKEFGVNEGAAAKVMLLQNLMSATKCSAEDLAKLGRVQIALRENGVSAASIASAISGLVDSKLGQEILNAAKMSIRKVCKNLALDHEAIEFGGKLRDCLDKSDAYSKDVVAKAFNYGADAAGLTPEDLATVALAQKVLSASGVSPEEMSQLLQVQKSLFASGHTAEQIAEILSKMAGEGLSDKEVENIMERAIAQGGQLTSEDVENLARLQKALKKGNLSSSITSDTVRGIVMLQEALEAAGASDEDMSKVLELMSSGQMSDQAVQDMMTKILAGKSVDPGIFSDLSSAQACFADGSLTGIRISAEGARQLAKLHHFLVSSGLRPENVKMSISMVTSGGLIDPEIGQLIADVAARSPMAAVGNAIIKDLAELLSSGGLKGKSLIPDTVAKIQLLKKSLEDQSMSDEDVAAAILKITASSKENTEKASDSAIEKLTTSNGVIGCISDGALQGVAAISDALQKAGLDSQEVGKVLSLLQKKSLDGLEMEALSEIISEQLSGKGVSKAQIASVLRDLKDNLGEKKVKLPSLTEGNFEHIALLNKVLKTSGLGKEEAHLLMAKAVNEGLNEQEINEALMGAQENSSLTEQEKAQLQDLQVSLKEKEFRTGGVKRGTMQSLTDIDQALKKAGLSDDKIAGVLGKIIKLSCDDLSSQEMEAAVGKILAEVGCGKSQVEEVLDNINKNLGAAFTDLANLSDKGVENLVLLKEVLNANDLSEQAANELLCKAVNEGLSQSEIDFLIKKAQGSVSPSKLDNLRESLEGQELRTCHVKDHTVDVIASLNTALQKAGLDCNAISKVMSTLSQKSGLKPSDIESLISRVLSEEGVSDEAKKEALESIMNALGSDLVTLPRLGGNNWDQLQLLQKVLTATSVPDEEMKNMLKKALNEGLSDDDVNAVLKAAMDCPDFIREKEKLTSLEKCLKSQQLTVGNVGNSALDPNIADLIENIKSGNLSLGDVELLKETLKTKGLSDKEVSDVLSSLEQEAIDTAKVEEDIIARLTSDNGVIGCIKEKSLHDAALLSDALQSVGVSTNAATRILLGLTKKALHGLSPKDLQGLLAEQLAAEGISSDGIKQVLEAISDNIGTGLVELPSLTEGNFEQMLFLQKVLKVTGVDDEQSKTLLAKAVNEGLNAREINEIIKNAQSHPSLSDEEKARLKDLEECLEKKGFRAPGVKTATMDSLANISGTLEKMGLSEDAVARLVTEILKNSSSESPKEVETALRKALEAEGCDQSTIKAIVESIGDNLDRSAFQDLANLTGDNVEKLLLLEKVIRESDLDRREANKLLCKAVNEGLSQEEIDSLIEKGQASSSLSEEIKNKLGGLRESLEDQQLRCCNVRDESVELIFSIRDALQSSGLDSSKIAKVMSKLSEKSRGGGLNREDFQGLLSALLAEEGLDEGAREAVLRIVREKGDSGEMMFLPNMTQKSFEEMLLLCEALSDGDFSEEERKKTLKKVLNLGLSDEEVDAILERAGDNLDPVDREKLKKRLNDGGLTLSGSTETKITPEDLAVLDSIRKGLLKISDEDRNSFDKLSILAKGLESAGDSPEAIQKVIRKVLTTGLIKGEINETLKKLQAANPLPLTEAELTAAVREMLTSKGLSEIPSDTVDGILQLQHALESLGKDPKEQRKILMQVLHGDLKPSDLEKLIKTLKESDNLPPDVSKNLQSLESSLRCGNMTAKEVTEGSLDQLLDLSKVLNATSSSPEAAAELLKRVMKGELTDDEVEAATKAISRVLVKDNEDMAALENAIRSGELQTVGIRPKAVEDILTLSKAMKAVGMSNDEAAKILSAISKGDFDDVAGTKQIRERLKQLGIPAEAMDAVEDAILNSRIKEEPVDDKSLEQLLLLADGLEKSGVNSEEVSRILSKATGAGMDDAEVSKIMKTVSGSKNLSKEEKEALQKVGQSLKKGHLRTCAMKDSTLDAISAVSRALEESGLDSTKICKVLSQIKGASDPHEVESIISKALAEEGVDSEVAKSLLNDIGDLASGLAAEMPNMTPDHLKQALFLKRVLEASDIPDASAKELLSKALNQGLSASEIAGVMKQAKGKKSTLSDEEKMQLKQLEKCLQEDALKIRGSSPDSIGKVLAVQKVLEASDLSPEQIGAIMKKLTDGDALSNTEASDLISSVLKKRNISPDDFEQLLKIEKDLKSGGLKVPGLSLDVLDKASKLKKALEAAGGRSAQEISNIISTVLNSGLSEKVATDLANELAASGALTDEEEMSLRRSLMDGSMQLSKAGPEAILQQLDKDMLARALLAQRLLAQAGVDPEALAKVGLLQDLLLGSGASAEKIATALDPLASAVDDLARGLRQELKDGKGGSLGLDGAVIDAALMLQKTFGAGKAAEGAMERMTREEKKLLELMSGANDLGKMAMTIL